MPLYYTNKADKYEIRSSALSHELGISIEYIGGSYFKINKNNECRIAHGWRDVYNILSQIKFKKYMPSKRIVNHPKKRK